MAVVMLKWSHLFNISDLVFDGPFPPEIPVNDFIQMTLSWMTAADRTARRLVRCDPNGALLFSDPWNFFNPVEQGELAVANTIESTVTFTVENQGVLIATGVNLCQFFFKRRAGGADETVYVPGGSFYWFPHPAYSVRARCVPFATGGVSINGCTAYN